MRISGCDGVCYSPTAFPVYSRGRRRRRYTRVYRLPFLRQYTTSATGRANASGVLRKLQDSQESTKDYSKAATAGRKGTGSQTKETSRGRGTGETKAEAQQRQQAAGDRPQPTPSSDGFMDIPDGYDDGLPFD